MGAHLFFPFVINNFFTVTVDIKTEDWTNQTSGQARSSSVTSSRLLRAQLYHRLPLTCLQKADGSNYSLTMLNLQHSVEKSALRG